MMLFTRDLSKSCGMDVQGRKIKCLNGSCSMDSMCEWKLLYEFISDIYPKETSGCTFSF